MIGYYYYTSKIRPYLTEPEKSSYVLGGLTLATILFFSLLIIWPAVSSTIKVYSELKAGRQYENKLEEKIIAVDQAAVNLSSLSTQLYSIEARVPQGPSQPSLLEELNKDAGESNTSIVNISIDKSSGSHQGAKTLLLTLNVTSPSQSFSLFLKNLEEGRLILINGVNAHLREGEGQNFWDANIQAEGVYLP